MNALIGSNAKRWLLVAWMFSACFQLSAADFTVNMESYGFYNFRFRPNYLEIEVGDTVTWANNDYTQYGYMGYVAACLAGSQVIWSTGLVDPGDSVSITFPYVATYNYQDPDYASLGMTGTIVVKEAAPSQPPTLLAPEVLTDGSFQCVVSNLVVGTTNIVLASTNVAADPASWTMISSNIVVSTVETFMDSTAPTFGRRFYRACRP